MKLMHFLHFNDLSYAGTPEETAKNYKIKDKMKVKVLKLKKNSKSSCGSETNSKRSF